MTTQARDDANRRRTRGWGLVLAFIGAYLLLVVAGDWLPPPLLGIASTLWFIALFAAIMAEFVRRRRRVPPVGSAPTAQEVGMLTPIQQKIIWAGIACLGLLVCFLPWTYTIHWDGFHRERPAGYYFILTPPQAPTEEPRAGAKVDPQAQLRIEGAKVDVPRVIIPMIFVVCATIAAVILTRKNPQYQG
jgi:hypothetical protein